MHSALLVPLLFLWVTGELSTLRQLMKVPNEPGLSPNNGLENVGSDSSHSIVASPSDNMAIVLVTPDDAIGTGVRRSACPHKKLRPHYEASTAPAKGLRPGFFG